jgi:hypothetical protein
MRSEQGPRRKHRAGTIGKDLFSALVWEELHM